MEKCSCKTDAEWLNCDQLKGIQSAGASTYKRALRVIRRGNSKNLTVYACDWQNTIRNFLRNSGTDPETTYAEWPPERSSKLCDEGTKWEGGREISDGTDKIGEGMFNHNVPYYYGSD
eukprot:gnl/TRDRNA2_/TRDRNA2_177158_c0_seq35.p1 gnl/TRDRNA2_/TRDRNA2_177158_c0~~gnl/TRDRNA2_/TRDRNA2_177158_c0_seq35.p1  ORF type:complete len:118 (-),score=9.85 gnl/TRDRNA2_/TRDRNA2_177158_c0_seq35:48-401(-)